MLAAPERDILAGTAKGGSPAGNHARGIEAEILFCGKAAKKIGAESPVFFASQKKRAQTPHTPPFFKRGLSFFYFCGKFG
jgi:hypothetical protein